MAAVTEWVMTWWDIWFEHVHERKDFSKMVRACQKINKARAKAEAKRLKASRRLSTRHIDATSNS